MPEVKPLYLGKSIGDLNQRVDDSVLGAPIRVCKSIKKIFDAAENCRKEGDEEKSYVLYMRYVNAVMYVHKSAEFKRDKNYFSSMIGVNNVKEACEWSEKLSKSLEERYKLLQEEAELSKKFKEKDMNHDKAVSVQNVKIEITEESEIIKKYNELMLNHDKSKGTHNNITEIKELESPELNGIKEPSGSISCHKLYELLLDKSVELIIMDTRTEKDFTSSHINHHCTINIPEEIIIPGITAPKLEVALPTDSISLWKMRAHADFIILLDWFSCITKPPVNQSILSLKDAVFKWDTRTILKSEPLVLSGGYDSWLNYYPTITTNSSVERPKHNSLSVDLITMDFDYPLDDLDIAFIQSSTDSSVEESHIQDEKNSSIVNISKTLPTIDRTTKPKISSSSGAADDNITSIKSEDTSTKQGNVVVSSIESTSKMCMPSVNRYLKPAYGSTVDKKDVDGDVINQMRIAQEIVFKNKENANAGFELEKERLMKEKEIDLIRLKMEKAAEEIMKLELQNQESALLQKIIEMEEEQKQRDLDNLKMKTENEQLKLKMEEIQQYNATEHKRLKDEMDHIRKKEEERKKLEEEVQRLRLDRKRKENLKRINTKKDEIVSSPKHSPKLRSQISSPVSKKIVPDVKSKTTYTKLKDDSSFNDGAFRGNLSRSHSFPNIAQLYDNEDAIVNTNKPPSERSQVSSAGLTRSERVVPFVDRNVKPTRVEINAATNRDFMPVFGGQGRALTGLRNLGNTCFMNSVIQPLANTSPLVNYFTHGTYKNDINRSSKLGHQGELVEEFAAIIRALWTGQYRSISPRDFKRVISKYYKMFEGYEQQDSQEFLTILMDNLHEDLNKADVKKVKELQKEIKSLEDSILQEQKIAIKSWEIHKLMNDSLIVEYFQGQYKSTLRCLHCDKTSTKFDTFMFLSLPIPSGSRCSLKDCLQLYLKEEKMTGSSKWKCPKCKELREAQKKIDIWKLPPILLIHLKRFFYEGVWRKKLQTYVDFPIEELDLRNYVKGPENRTKFNLYAVTNHYGTMEGGHYTSYCKNDQHKRWFKFDDHDVHEMHQSDVKSAAAYILYYTSDEYEGKFG